MERNDIEPVKSNLVLDTTKCSQNSSNIPVSHGNSGFNLSTLNSTMEPSSAKRSVLSTIAANTPGEDETDRFVLCSPIDNQLQTDLTSFYDSPIDQQAFNSEGVDKGQGHKADISATVAMGTEFDGVDMDDFEQMTDQTNDYSADFIQSLLQDKNSNQQTNQSQPSISESGNLAAFLDQSNQSLHYESSSNQVNQTLDMWAEMYDYVQSNLGDDDESDLDIGLNTQEGQPVNSHGQGSLTDAPDVIDLQDLSVTPSGEDQNENEGDNTCFV